MSEREWMSDAEKLETLRGMAKREALRRENAEAEVERLQTLLAAAQARAEAADAIMANGQRQWMAALEIVRAVTEAGVGNGYDGVSWLLFAGYDAETVREQARALLASIAATAEAGEQ